MPPIKVVTLTAEEHEELIARAYATGYSRAAEERERIMQALGADLDKPHRKPSLSVREAAKYAGRDEATVRRWIRRGLPAGMQEGVAGYRIRTADLEGWLHGERPVHPKARPSLASKSAASKSAK